MATRVTIYGIGDFGYALLKHLDDTNNDRYELVAYDYKKERVDHLNKYRVHPSKYPDIKLSENILFTSDLKRAITNCSVLVLSVPSTVTREAFQNIKNYANSAISIVNTSKSFDLESGMRLSEIASQYLPRHTYAVISGGTVASDLFSCEPLGMDLACEDADALPALQIIFESNSLHLYATGDVIGVEYAGALKNVVSILAGIVHGLGFSFGAETHFISRTAQSLADVCIKELGASPNTFSMGSQSWGNDLWMSSTGNTRNRTFGILIGQGMTPSKAFASMQNNGQLVEGLSTLKAIQNIKPILEIPIINKLSELIVHERSTVDELRDHLMRNS